MERRLVNITVRWFLAPTYVNAMAQTTDAWRIDRVNSRCGWFVQSTLN